MKQSTYLALILGTIVTLIVLTVDRLGGTRPWERLSIDWRFGAAPRPPQPMTDAIVHVDIDDAAIDHVGRWPWSRTRLAEVIDELRRAGAKTIALDLLLTDPSEPGAIDHDARFAAALAEADSVLAADIHTGPLYDEAWRTLRGAEELARIMETLGADIQLDNDALLEQAGVSGERRLRYVERPLMFKQAAAWRTLENAQPAFESFEQFERAIAPRVGPKIGFYPEKPLLRTVWRQYRAWQAAQPLLIDASGRGSFRDKAPLPQFVAAAEALGFVNVKDQRHPDGVIREVAVAAPTHGGAVPHFALAAAAHFHGVASTDITFTDRQVVIGDTVLPLRDGNLWIDWPTSDTEPRWLGLLRQSPDDPHGAGHLSIREIVELARARQIIADNVQKLTEVTRYVLLDMGNEVPKETPASALLADDVQRVVADEVDFALSGPPPDPPGPDATDAEKQAYDLDKRKYDNAANWRRIGRTIEESRTIVTESEAALRQHIDGKLVFIGWTATGSIADFFPTPIDEHTPGVVVHAVIANMALTDRHVRFLPDGVEVAILLGIGLLCTALSSWLSTAPSAAAVIAVLFGYGYLATSWLFPQHNLLAPLVGPLVAGLTAWVACTALQAALAQRERQRITRQFKARVSAQLVDYLVDNPDAVTVSGDEREMTILFGDLAGFTSISETLGGRITVSTLNRYMGELTDLLIRHDAYMNKFLGDGLMAFWSAFSIDPKQATKACAAALECQQAVQRLNDDPEFKDIPKLGLRLGIATGRVIVGDCGAPPALNDYTVIGDAVNLAARLESANKQFGTRILINGRTEELMDAAAVATGDDHGAVRLRSLGKIVVVGQSKPVDLYDVVPSEMPDEQIKLTEKMTEAYREGRFDDAMRFLDKLAADYDEAKLTDVYRDAIDLAREDDAFDGVLRLREK